MYNSKQRRKGVLVGVQKMERSRIKFLSKKNYFVFQLVVTRDVCTCGIHECMNEMLYVFNCEL